jgi:hypothetical protein
LTVKPSATLSPCLSTRCISRSPARIRLRSQCGAAAMEMARTSEAPRSGRAEPESKDARSPLNNSPRVARDARFASLRSSHGADSILPRVKDRTVTGPARARRSKW